MSMADASSKNQSGVDAVPECTTDPELGNGAPLGRSNSFTLKAKTSVQWQVLSGPLEPGSDLALTLVLRLLPRALALTLTHYSPAPHARSLDRT